MARENPAREKKGGRPSKSESKEGSKFEPLPKGNANKRVLARLARDNPELLDKIEAGELSVNQAAIKDDAECLAMFRQAMKEQGNNQHTSKLNIVKDAQVVAGNSKAYTCERLKREAPELFEQVVAGREDHPEWTQQRIADEVGVDKAYVSRTLTKSCDSQESVNVPPHLNGDHEKADYRKLPQDMREAVAQKKISLNAAAIQAGIRKRPSALDQLRANWRKATEDEREAFLREIEAASRCSERR
jgi:hypothetical protein